MADLIETAGGLLGLVIVAGVAEKVLDSPKGKKKSKPIFKDSKEKPIKW